MRFQEFLSRSYMPLTVLILSFLFSLTSFFATERDVVSRFFFYPYNSGDNEGVERRAIPNRKGEELGLEVFLEELFAGPVALELSRTVPSGTVLRHVALVGRTAYVDLSKRMINTSEDFSLSFDQSIENIQYNIQYNFPKIETIVFTVEGRQIYAPYYSPQIE